MNLALTQSTWPQAVAGKLRVLHAVILRETRVRFAGRRLGYLWAVFEPLSHIFIFVAIFYVLERVSPVTESMPVFFASGVLPWLLFSRIVAQISSSVDANKALLLYPHIYPVDFMLCRMIIESATCLMVTLILAFAAYIFEGFVVDSPLQALSAWMIITLLGGGVGMINAIAISFAPAYANVYKMVQRLLYFASGVFFLASELPLTVQERLKWNPLLHMTDWFRSVVLPSYESEFARPQFVIALALAVFLAGLMGERQRRKALRTP